MLYTKNYNYKDADLTFSLRTYKDADRLHWCLDNLRRHYPRARVIVISDGDPLIKKSDLLIYKYKVEFFEGENLTGIENGGKLIQRMVELFAKDPTYYLFKIDTDTGIHRRFKWLPWGYGAFGQLQHDGYLCSLQGGFMGMSYEVVADIYKSGLCQSPDLVDYKSSYALSPFILDYCESRGKIGEDWIWGYIFAKLGVPLFGFNEVKSYWLDYIPNPDLEFAITHPCKDLKL